MEFDSEKKTIEGLLNSKKEFTVPRFQREYSWNYRQLSDFYDDIIGKIKLENGILKTTDYFWGTMLFIGSFTESSFKMEVVDGQQRLTTITIFLSILADIFENKDQKTIAAKLKEFILFEDNDGNDHSVLVNETPYPYFQERVQKSDTNAIAKTEEEKKIEDAVKFFETKLEISALKKDFRRCSDYDIQNIQIVEILKVMRDQLFGSIVMCLSTKDKAQANMIFEILNAKGKPLDAIDLIKNQIFSVMVHEVPCDEAKVNWKKITDHLYSRNIIADLSIFYRHFWSSNYSRNTERQLYEAFKKKVRPKDEETYGSFLKKMVNSSKYYLVILDPQLIDFGNNNKYAYIIESLNNISKTFNIVISRILLLSLLECYLDKKTISSKMFKKALNCLEKFHFVYNALLSSGSSPLETPFSNFSVKLRNCISKTETAQVIEELIKFTSNKMPNYSRFEEAFLRLKFSKSDIPSNMKTKYVVKCFEKHFSNRDISPVDLSVEHIMDEDQSESFTLSLGNLILLESKINNEIPENSTFAEKGVLYSHSTYRSIIEFQKQNYVDWDETLIEKRGKELAKIFYSQILGISD